MIRMLFTTLAVTFIVAGELVVGQPTVKGYFCSSQHETHGCKTESNDCSRQKLLTIEAELQLTKTELSTTKTMLNRTEESSRQKLQTIEAELQSTKGELATIKTVLNRMEEHLLTSSERKLSSNGPTIYKTRTLDIGDKCIWGAAWWRSRLYLGLDPPRMDVFDDVTWNLTANTALPGVGCISDIATCQQCDALYVADHCYRQIHVVKEQQVVATWSAVGESHGISVNSQRNLIVTYHIDRKIREFTASGSLVREINLTSDVQKPSHAVELLGGRYLVSHGGSGDRGTLQRIVMIDRNGHVIQQYGDSNGLLRSPARMALYGDYVFVLDLGNSRIVLFKASPLTFIRQLTTTSTSPKRISLNGDGSQLYVAVHEYNSFANACHSVVVEVYNINW